MVLGASPPVKSATKAASRSAPSANHWADVIRALEHDRHQSRIKKLLIYLCTNHWEVDGDRLNHYALDHLVQQLLTIAPTLEALRMTLDQVVSTLNKPAEYTIVANTITNSVSQLYPEIAQQQAAHQSTYQSIAAIFIADRHYLRIKKLLVLACRNLWEQDSAQLARFSDVQLAQELHQLNPTPERLRIVLKNLVTTLSKQAEYTEIANRICLAYQPLYQPKPTDKPTDKLTHKPTHKPTRSPVSEDATAALSVLLNHPAAGLGSAAPASYPADRVAPNPAAQPSKRSVRGTSQAQQISHPQQIGCPQPDRLDLFDLRLDLMQHTNPYQAKILLFSVIHEPISDEMNAMTLLKEHDLDDLLRMAMRIHKTFLELETGLYRVARQLDYSQGANRSGDYQQVANVLLRRVRSVYPTASVPTTPPRDEVATKIAGMHGMGTGVDTDDATQPDSRR